MRCSIIWQTRSLICLKYEDITPLSVLETPREKTRMHLCVLGVYFEEKYCICIAIRNSEYIAMKKGTLHKGVPIFPEPFLARVNS